MKPMLFLFVLFCFVTVNCGAAPAKSANALPKLAPPPIVSQWKEERVKVVETGDFSSISVPEKKRASGRKAKKAAARSAVDLVAEKGKKFFWKPSPLLSSTLRVADLTGAALSQDGTLAVVAERIGGEGKANSTRLIFFDVRDRRLAGGFILPEVLITSIAFVPGSQRELLGIRKKFAPYKVADGLVKIDLWGKEIIDSLDSPGGALTSFAADGKGKIFFTTAGRSFIYEQDADSFSVESTPIKSRITSPRVCVAGSLLAAYGRNGLEIFRRDHGRWVADEKIFTFPESFAPVSSCFIDPAVPALCLAGAYEDDLWYFRGGTFRKLKGRTSGIHVWDAEKKLFFAEVASNSRVFTYSMPEGSEMEKSATPNRLRPASRNASFALLKSPAYKEKMLQIDNRGNVYLLDYSRPARWRKSIVHITDRTGLR